MYKVCIADDEIHNHALFQNLVDWSGKGFTIAGFATDGKEALDLFSSIQPELMIIDIRMPIIDGLECIRKIRSLSSKVHIIVISAYSEFSYAQKAIDLDVEGYLLKPVNRSVLCELIDKIVDKIIKENKESQTIHTDHLTNKNAKLRYDLQLFASQQAIQPEQINELISENIYLLEMSLYDDSQQPLDETDSIKELYFFENTLTECIDTVPVRCQITSSRFLFAIPLPSDHLREKLTGYLHSARTRHIFPDLCLSAESLNQQNILKMQKAFSNTADLLFFHTNGCIKDVSSQTWIEINEINIPDAYESISQAIERLSANPLQQYLQDIMNQLQYLQVPGQIAKNACFDLLVQLKISLRRLCPFETFDTLRGIRAEDLSSHKKPLTLLSYMNHIFENVFLQLRQIERSSHHGVLIILQANLYTDKNFAKKDFSSTQVSIHVGLSKNYFLKLYKEITQTGFWDYVTELRMEKAKHLLRNTNRTSASISGDVGYESEYHFSRKFKQITGLTPLQFRKKNLMI